MTLDEMILRVKQLQQAGLLPIKSTKEQAISWVYGNTKLANEGITYEMVAKAVEESGHYDG